MRAARRRVRRVVQPGLADRRDDHEVTSFVFLGYEFRPRLAKSRAGHHFVSFLPAVSTDAKNSSRYLVHLSQSGLGLPDESYYRDDSCFDDGTGTDPGGGVTANDLRRIAPTLVQDSLRNGLPRALPDDAEFTAGQGARSAYEKAWSVAAFTAEEFGVDSLTSLYRALSTGPAEPDEVDDALREVVGLGTGDYVGRWGDWVSERLTVG